MSPPQRSDIVVESKIANGLKTTLSRSFAPNAGKTKALLKTDVWLDRLPAENYVKLALSSQVEAGKNFAQGGHKIGVALEFSS